jgi:transposase
VLDALHEAGLTELFVTIALAAAKIEGVNTNTSHLDSTSFHVHGLYNREQTLVNGEPIPINITYGYSRDHRPDLKQFIVDLICSGDGGIPLYLRMADGNESDQAIFASLMNEFRENWEMDSLFVADAALYSEENLQQIKHLRWLSRVPATLSQAKQLISELPDVVLRDSTLPGYKIASCCSNYGGIRQRWLVVESEKRKKSDLKKLRQKIEKK